MIRAGDPGDAPVWDSFYAGGGGDEPRWSGDPNASLVAEATGLLPGTALDVGCGEGADAIWLARHGWQVTAVDPSRVALERAEVAAREAGVGVGWVHEGLAEMAGGTGEHDLVSVHYAVLDRTDAVIGTLLAAVAPGGTLLVVHHEGFPEHAGEHHHGPGAWLTPADVAENLDDGWEIEVYGRRERAGSGDHHPADVILRARRLTSRGGAPRPRPRARGAGLSG